MRKNRELQDGAIYHVTARANRKEMILDPSSIKELFLSVLKRAKRKYAFRIHNFCIMGNHIHLVIQPGRGQSLSSIMQWILSVFAMAYNKLMQLTGHVWGCRFFSSIIAGMRSLLQVFDYIDANPEKSRQITNRRGWLWGGLWHDRSGCREIVEAMPDCLKLQLPVHGQLLLSSSVGLLGS